MSNTIRIEVAYAMPEHQKIISFQIDSSTSIRDAVKFSQIHQYFPKIDVESCDLGVFSKPVNADYKLMDGDRIEIYRPLKIDPKEIRRLRAKQQNAKAKSGQNHR